MVNKDTSKKSCRVSKIILEINSVDCSCYRVCSEIAVEWKNDLLENIEAGKFQGKYVSYYVN